MPRDRDKMIAAVWSLPPAERLARLVGVIVEGNPGATAPLRGMISVIATMARYLSTEKRFEIAERLRDVADALEHQHKVSIEIK